MLSMSFDFSETNTNRSGSWNGGGRNTTAFITLNIAVFAPMPSASMSTATTVKPGFFNNCRTANLRSFITQCLHRIHFRGSPGGQPASQEPHGAEQKTHCHKREWIGWTDAVEEIAQHLGQTEGRGQSKSRADCGELHPLPQDQSQHVGAVR